MLRSLTTRAPCSSGTVAERLAKASSPREQAIVRCTIWQPRSCKNLSLLCRAAVDTAAPSTPALSREDFHKSGGTEAEFVLLQASKEAEGQGDISAELDRLSVPSGTLDVVVVGCGPAGLALAAELGQRGLAVGLLGKHCAFVNNYGVWPDEFQKLGLGSCIDQVWEDTILYTDSDTPIHTQRPYGRVDRGRLQAELISRCKKAGVRHLADDVEDVEGISASGSTVVTSEGLRVQARLVIIAAGAASGKFLRYASQTQGVGAQTAYGIEVELDSPYPYDPQAMLFMDYRDLPPAEAGTGHREGAFSDLPTFLYAMPSTPQKVFFEETCLAARPGMPFSILKDRLHRRLKGLGVSYSTVIEEEWSYIPVGGDLPDTRQQTLGFGAAASLIHPATGYSITRSLSEAPAFASAITSALAAGGSGHAALSSPAAAQQAWSVLWSPERKRQRAFMIFGLELILQLDKGTTRDFFNSFFRLPPWLWRGFLASSLSSTDLLLFALTTFAVAPNALRFQLVKHLVTHPSGAKMLKAYLGQE